MVKAAGRRDREWRLTWGKKRADETFSHSAVLTHFQTRRDTEDKSDPEQRGRDGNASPVPDIQSRRSDIQSRRTRSAGQFLSLRPGGLRGRDPGLRQRAAAAAAAQLIGADHRNKRSLSGLAHAKAVRAVAKAKDRQWRENRM